MNTTLTQRIVNEGSAEVWVVAQQHRGLLHFLACGSIDGEKSALIGRPLRGIHQIYEDQLLSLHNDSKCYGIQGERLDLALLANDLQTERKQGITIGMAYHYFSIEERKFIITDIPGHEQCIRSVTTGVSTCGLAILLIGAHKDVLDQTRRHSFISTLLEIKHLMMVINKMDLVNSSEETFNCTREGRLAFAEQLLDGLDTRFVPLSTLEGSNVASQSTNMSWYSGPTLLEVLETVKIQRIIDTQSVRSPMQYANRPNLDFRGYAGALASGNMKVGQCVKMLPSGAESNVAQIITFDDDLQGTHAGKAITLVLKGEIDINRGDLLFNAGETLPAVQSATVDMM